MPEPPKAIYAASCNPPRRAKRSGTDSNSSEEPRVTSSPTLPPKQASQPRPILPKRPINSAKANPRMDLPSYHDTGSPPPVPAPAKRGRKPGPLSRTAREAQRRLNHSIIEKARRTKINEALATLKELVPADYGQKQAPAEEANGSDDDEDYDDGSKKKKSAKPGGKREEKEKEFKLEILIRTVSFMQDLLERVSALEQAAQSCSNCGVNVATTKKRKRSQADDQSAKDTRGAPRPRRMSDGESSDSASRPSAFSKPPATEEQQVVESLPTPPESRLPPISSWLPTPVIDPSLLSPTSSQPQPPQSSSTTYLPSPPSSTRFDPVRSNNIPPSLSLGPVATASMLSPTRTPEDESAASLLLQISASSPPFRPVSSYPLSDPSKLVLPSTTKPYRSTDAQTPSSLLGLNHPPNH